MVWRAIFLPAALLIAAVSMPASRAAAADLGGDQIATSAGPLVIHPIHHATFLMAWNGRIIDFDPVGGKAAFGGLPTPDLVFITHDHPDHFNVPTLTLITRPDTRLIAPQAVFALMPDALKKQTHVMRNGDSYDIEGIHIDAIAAYNLPPNMHHPKGRGNGYVLTMGAKRIYVSGDTDGTPEMRSLKHIDVAFVCMNPPYTMSVEQAAAAVLAFKPHIVYPYHYRSPNGPNDLQKFKRLVGADKSIEVRIRNWYPAM